MKSWNVPINSKTMIDVRKPRVNDGFLTTRKFGTAGVEAPEHDIYSRKEYQNGNELVLLVKQSYLRRLRMVFYTDHFPVYVYVRLN